jgi:16S rRNA (cytosine967-C5)-methyltransferase
VEARDVSDYKVQLILENASRMHLTNLQAAVQDACETDPDMLGRADVLLLDVPCSGLGIMGHKRDIKYRINRENLDTLQELQHSIVSTCLPYVKQGGTVIYSTCTIRQEENEEMAQWISEMPGLERQSLDAFLPECLHSEETGRGMLQLFPGEHDCDGFFLARFIKK